MLTQRYYDRVQGGELRLLAPHGWGLICQLCSDRWQRNTAGAEMLYFIENGELPNDATILSEVVPSVGGDYFPIFRTTRPALH